MLTVTSVLPNIPLSPSLEELFQILSVFFLFSNFLLRSGFGSVLWVCSVWSFFWSTFSITLWTYYISTVYILYIQRVYDSMCILSSDFILSHFLFYLILFHFVYPYSMQFFCLQKSDWVLHVCFQYISDFSPY